MKYLGTVSDPKDVATKEYVDSVAAGGSGTSVSDTGWVDVTPVKGTWSYFKVRRVGALVNVRAHASAYAWGGSTGEQMAVIPAGYRPPFGNLYSYQQSSARRTAKIGITTAGNVFLDSVWDASGDNYTGSSWLNIDFTYLI